MVSDDKLLKIYMIGFSDELDDNTNDKEYHDIELKAYNIGVVDAIIGDDISSSDLQTNDMILRRIRK